MLIQSFNNNKIQSADIIYATNQNAAYPATNFLTKYTRDKAKFTTSTTIRLDNVSSARDICIFGLTGATSGTIRIETETSNVVTLTSNTTYTTNTDILGTLTSNDGITVTSNDGITVRGVGTGLIEQSLSFSDGNLRRENFYFDYGSTATLFIGLSLTGASQIGLFWAGVLADYGYSEKWSGDSYDFLATKANYKALELLDKRLFYIVHPNRNQNGDMLLYGSVTIAKINYSEDLWLDGVAYGETNIEVKENV